MKKNVRKVLIAIGVIIAISLVLFFVFKAIGITNKGKIYAIINNAGAYGILVYVLLYVIVNSFLCFIPATDMAFLTVAMLIYGTNVKCFLICYVAIILTSVVMDAIGRFGGSKLVKKIIGDDDYESTMKLVRVKGTTYTPIMYLFPLFPDNFICMANGVLKTNWIIHFIEIVLCRGIGVATIIFGVNVLPNELMRNLKNFNIYYIRENIFNYIIVITVIAFWVFMLFYIARKIDKALTKRIEKKNAKRTIR